MGSEFGTAFAEMGWFAIGAPTNRMSNSFEDDVIQHWNSLNGIVALAARTSLCALVGSATLLAAGSASASYEGTIGINWGTDTNISSGANNIQSVFDTALAPLGVTATITGAVADNTYTADGNVVGTVGTNGTVTSYTLANYTGGTFLQNISEPTGNQQATNSFTITFSSAIDLRSISFDYEIFPNINCTALGSSCGGSGNPDLPSLNVTETYLSATTGKSTSAMVFQRWGEVPGGSTVVGGQGYNHSPYNQNQGSITNPNDPLTTCSGITNTTQEDCGGGGTVITTTSTTAYTGTPGSAQSGDVTDHSETTGAQVTYKNGKYAVTSTTDMETAPQLLGTSGTVSLTVGTGVTSLTFNDWPATIAISQISFKVPEPGSWSVIVPGLLLLGLIGYRRKAAAWGGNRRA